MISPFRALRYDDPDSLEDGVVDLDTVICSIEALTDGALQAGSKQASFNVAQLLDQPSLADQWQADGWLRRDGEPAMYLYRIGFTGPDGQRSQWSGVFARTGGESADAGLQTVPEQIPIGAEGFSELLSPFGLMPLCRATDEHGAHHRIWAITQPGVIELINDAASRYQQSALARLQPGTLVLISEATQPSYPPALGLVMA